jgi:hypothetical protein
VTTPSTVRTDDAAAELGADDREVRSGASRRQLARRVEEREPRRRPAPHGERSTSPSANTVTLRCASGRRPRLPEDDAVDVAQLRLARVDDLVARLERRA